MRTHEPEITEIASYIATKIPTQGVAQDEAIDAWRHALRYARSAGAIDKLAEEVASAHPTDLHLQKVCVDVAS